EVPSATVTARPSTSSVMSFAESRAGVPRSLSLIDNTASLPSRNKNHSLVYSNTSLVYRWKTKISGKIFEHAEDRQRRQAAERAQRAGGHGVAEVAQQFNTIRAIAIRDNAIDNLNAA